MNTNRPTRRAPAADHLESSKIERSSSNTLTRRDQVVLEFQRSMLEMTNSFIKAQEQVMLAYLGQRDTGEELVVGSEYPSDASAYQPEEANSAVQHLVGEASVELEVEAPSTEPEAVFEEQASLEEIKLETPVIATPDSTGAVTAETLIASLLEIVSERTGYPAELLDPSLDMEADLGIDSIKRVEILNGLRKLLPEEKQTQMEESIEQVIGIKTLDGIMEWIRAEFPEGSTSAEGAGERALSATTSDA